MKPEERRLPVFLAYLNARLSGMPLLMIFWFLWMLLTSAFILTKMPGLTRSDRNIASTEIAVAGLGVALFLFVLASAIGRKAGRKWLVCDIDRDSRMQAGFFSRWAIRIIPVLSLLIILEYMFYH
jgi:hypothetical protein